MLSQYFTSTDLSVISLSLSDHSPTLRWPKLAAASRRSSSPSWKKFSQKEFSPLLRWNLTAMSMMRPTGPPTVVSPGQRGGSSATGRGRGETLSSRGGITSNHGHKYAVFACNYAVFIQRPVGLQHCFHSVIWKELQFVVCNNITVLPSDGSWTHWNNSSDIWKVGANCSWSEEHRT